MKASAGAGADFAVIGAGIVGAATAYALARTHPGARIVVVDKEDGPSRHQTGRNSGVIHSGIYYTPGSLKARLCREGMSRTVAFCKENGVAFERRGKLIVASDESELSPLDRLGARAGENGVEAVRLSAGELQAEEPAIRGAAALLVPQTGIVDYPGMVRAMLGALERAGGTVRYASTVLGLRRTGTGWQLDTSSGPIQAARVVACGGLASDRIARMAGLAPGIRILPFKGEYFVLPAERSAIVRRMIYPVPDPRLPFLGVHLTPMIDGSTTVGPNAVLSLAREGYGKFGFDRRDAAEALLFPGLWRLLARFPRAVASELAGTASKRFYLRLLRRYCPSLTLSDLRGYRSGIRAQAVTADGRMVEDFLVAEEDGLVVVLNAPSPAATSALPIGDHVAALAAKGF